MDNQKKRNSNFELMRILSMLMIILWHIIIHGKIIENCTRDSLKIFYQFLEFFLVVHVNSFVMLSGYFQFKNPFRVSKLLKNINLCWFYRIIILIFLTLIRVWQPTHLEIFQQTFILDLGIYWFMDIFIFLYCISPYLNRLISLLNKKEFKRLLFLLFMIFSIIPYITGHKTYANNGYTLSNFIFIYFLGAYLGKYSISFKLSKKKSQFLYVSIFIGMGLINFLLTKGAEKIIVYNSFSSELGSNIIISSLNYSNPLVIIETIGYFLFFTTLSFQNKLINKISICTIGVYLLHDHPAIRGNLYCWLNIDTNLIFSYRFIINVVIAMELIFICCSLIEWIRQGLVKLMCKLKIFKYLKNQLVKFIETKMHLLY